MWRFTATSLRERSTSTTAQRFLKQTLGSKRLQHGVAFQLDYYMSPQFGGIASALVDGKYKDAGISLSFLPICPVGLEQERVRNHQDLHPGDVTFGSVEQNIFIPTLYNNPSLKVKAVAAMFQRSPLCIASLKGGVNEGRTIGAHEDTVELLQRIFPNDKVIASARATKNSDLQSGSLDAIQAYTTTEVPALRRCGDDPLVTELEGLRSNGETVKLGYGQVVFASDESLNDDRLDVVKAFLNATFDGWADSIRSPSETCDKISEAKKMLGLDDEANDHWYPSAEFDLEMLNLCNNFVKQTFEGDRHGVVNAQRWNEASVWLLEGKKIETDFGLDSSVWQPSSQVLAGGSLAQKTLEEAKTSANLFEETFGRKPSLAVLTVGKLKRYTHGERRVELYSTKNTSWFSKTSAGSANGYDVKEIDLDESTTTEELLSQIYALKDVDGIQLMWPLPDHIDASKIYNAIDLAKDVDGIHYVGQMEIGNKDAHPPVTPAGAMALMEAHNVDLKDKRVLVVGRSPIVGSPIARMVREKGALVTVAHSEVSGANLKRMVSESDVVICCAGEPGLIKAEWIKPGAEIINVGTTFVEETDSLHSDVEGDIGSYAGRYSPVPGGIGPLSNPFLFANTARAAWDRMRSAEGSVQFSWERHPASLKKTFHFDSYDQALEMAGKVNSLSTIMDHHANMSFTHKCVNGVDVEMEFFTFEASELTEKDFQAARAIDLLFGGKNQIRMSDYSYNLREESIAKYPASPRGSSKLLQVDGEGRISYYDNFSEVFGALAEGAHIVFNESRVLDARVFVKTSGGKAVELMILDLGNIDVQNDCRSTPLTAMVRVQNAKAGDIFQSGVSTVEVVEVKGIWEEDEKSDGNGMECVVRIHSDLSVEEYLKQSGSVPIPPYFHRQAEESDKEAYNNVYAKNAGSVAAPTAGLHFTDALLAEIGQENCSYLSLHVGAGTFKPVMAQDARDHSMHAEHFSVSVWEINNIIAAIEAGKPLIVVGTTSSRTLETLFWCGLRKLRGLDTERFDPKALEMEQFEWVPLNVGSGKRSKGRTAAALKALVEGMDDLDTLEGRTSLMIAPPHYDFQVPDHLVTNFHAPDSTLMLLVSAFLKSGKKVKRVYEDAQANGFRFLSYGDVCFFSRQGGNN